MTSKPQFRTFSSDYSRTNISLLNVLSLEGVIFTISVITPKKPFALFKKSSIYVNTGFFVFIICFYESKCSALDQRLTIREQVLQQEMSLIVASVFVVCMLYGHGYKDI